MFSASPPANNTFGLLAPANGDTHCTVFQVFLSVDGVCEPNKCTRNLPILAPSTFNSFSTLAQKFTTDGESHINAGDFHHETAPKIHMNGPIALKATKVPGISFQADADGNLLYTNILSERTSSSLNSPKVTESKRGSILTRFTTREPYPDHEQSNLENQS